MSQKDLEKNSLEKIINNIKNPKVILEAGRRDRYKKLVVEGKNKADENKESSGYSKGNKASPVDTYIEHKFRRKNDFDGFQYEEKTMLVDKDNRILIPKKIRDIEGIEPGDRIRFSDVNGEIILEKVSNRSELESDLEKGYKENAEKSKEINEEMILLSKEAFKDK